MKPAGPAPRRFIPWLVLGGFALLLLSWIVFMGSHLMRQSSRPPSAEPPPRVAPAHPR